MVRGILAHGEARNISYVHTFILEKYSSAELHSQNDEIFKCKEHLFILLKTNRKLDEK